LVETFRSNNLFRPLFTTELIHVSHGISMLRYRFVRIPIHPSFKQFPALRGNVL